MSKKRITAPPSKVSDTVTTVLARSIVGIQRRWANWMQRRTRHWQPRHQANFLYAVLLIFGGVSTFLLVNTLHGNSPPVLDQGILQPVVPRPASPFSRQRLSPQADTLLFNRFHAYIDSLRCSPDTRGLDSFLKARPQFLDSVSRAEKMIRQFYY